ncbi:MAG: hypothetical protein K0U66_09305 [Gammaproteobacteria bacterium]|nr:hypothetical protein [Pseudomonadota bacterium]MCH9663834.1 hypothetical protein [Gammaproteobacteria bacterium]
MSEIRTQFIEDVQEILRKQLEIPAQQVINSEGVRQLLSVLPDPKYDGQITKHLKLAYDAMKVATKFKYEGYKALHVLFVQKYVSKMIGLICAIEKFDADAEGKDSAWTAVKLTYDFDECVRSVQYFTGQDTD